MFLVYLKTFSASQNPILKITKKFQVTHFPDRRVAIFPSLSPMSIFYEYENKKLSLFYI